MIKNNPGSGRRFLSLCAAISFLAAAARAASPVTLSIANSPGFRIPDDYAGLSFGAVSELPGSGGVPGDFFCGTNQQLITLFRNSGLHHLRLGGSTVEGIHAAVPSHADIDNVFAFAKAAGVKVIYSLPLENGDSVTDAATAKYIWDRYRPLIDCFAIANEPDIKRYHYPPFGTGTDPDITNYTSFLEKWKKFAAVVAPAVPGATFAGPDAAGKEWAQLFARDEKSSGLVTLITQHLYVGGRPYITENGPETIPVAEAIDHILSTNWVAVKYPAFYSNTIAPVLAEGLPYRMTESDDYLKGVPNASDSFATALWGLDYLHWFAARHCSGVNFHNTEWLKTDTVFYDATNHSTRINPKAYGVRAFDLGSNGSVEPVAMDNAEGLNLTAYAVGGPDALYVTVINKEHSANARAALVKIAPSGFSALGKEASVMYLVAESGAGATNGITLGGAPITNQSAWTGKWTRLKPGGEYVVTVAASSAAVVRIK